MAADPPPFVAPSPTSDERELLLGFLDCKRAAVIGAARGLDDQQARWTPDGKLLPVAGIVNHLTRVEARWIDGRYLREEPPPADPAAEFASTTPIGALVDAYCDRISKTNQVVRAAPGMDAACLGHESQRPRPGLDLRWVVLHLLEETAQHAGHAEATRELIDGHRNTR